MEQEILDAVYLYVVVLVLLVLKLVLHVRDTHRVCALLEELTGATEDKS